MKHGHEKAQLMKWWVLLVCISVRPRTEANHRPVALLNGDTTRNILRVAVKSGEAVKLSATGSTDPDGHTLACEWFVYREAGTCRNEISLRTTNGLTTSFVASDVNKAGTIHVIMRIKDDGQPPLCSYRRAVVTVQP